MRIDKRDPDRAFIDLHGFHPRDTDLYETVETAVREAHEAGLSELTIVHGHGFNRRRYFQPFVNSNTGYLGQTVRRMLRENKDRLRQWMYVKFDCSRQGATTVRLRRRRV